MQFREREPKQQALRLHVATKVFSHNHLSNSLEPSQSDKHLTQNFREALSMVDVRMLGAARCASPRALRTPRPSTPVFPFPWLRQKARKLHKIGPCEQGLRKCVIVNDIFMRETTNAYLR
ncbi:JAB domain-containing protein [Azoarcus taiwanensis]|uniref:JAB domain-containing protein n=1 Tax=Azoarcus taiwanensis TaxID=666964 RepID=UPI001FE6A2A8|nr:JAB domain-containing protein [Azoarcus taiwanensis]